MTSFTTPAFQSGDLELRYGDDEVMIYGTPQGLKRLAALCVKLAETPEATEHVHLEDYELLTCKSLRGVIAVFHKEESAPGAEDGRPSDGSSSG